MHLPALTWNTVCFLPARPSGGWERHYPHQLSVWHLGPPQAKTNLHSNPKEFLQERVKTSYSAEVQHVKDVIVA